MLKMENEKPAIIRILGTRKDVNLQQSFENSQYLCSLQPSASG